MSSKIELSEDWVIGSGAMIDRMINANGSPAAGAGHVRSNQGILGNSNILFSNYAVNNTTVGSVIFIMKGLMPSTALELTPNGTGDEINNRKTDRLVIFDDGSNDFQASKFTTNPIIINTVFREAIASGVATWFWMTSFGTHNWSGFTGSSAIGSIGLPGTGSDLELLDVNINIGEPYRISGMKLQFPTSWTF